MLLVIPGGGGGEQEPISQMELDVLLGIQNLLRDLEEKRKREARSIRARLRRGALVEPGTHRAKVAGNQLIVT
jgi:hypothetical protein